MKDQRHKEENLMLERLSELCFFVYRRTSGMSNNRSNKKEIYAKAIGTNLWPFFHQTPPYAQSWKWQIWVEEKFDWVKAWFAVNINCTGEVRTALVL